MNKLLQMVFGKGGVFVLAGLLAWLDFQGSQAESGGVTTSSEIWRAVLTIALSLIAFLGAAAYRDISRRVGSVEVNLEKLVQKLDLCVRSIEGRFQEQSNRATELKTVLMGVEGKGGLLSESSRMQDTQRGLSETIHAQEGKVELLIHFVETALKSKPKRKIEEP